MSYSHLIDNKEVDERKCVEWNVVAREMEGILLEAINSQPRESLFNKGRICEDFQKRRGKK